MKALMKTLRLVCFLLATVPLFGQGNPPVPESGVLWVDDQGNPVSKNQADFAVFYNFSYANGIKTLTLETFNCQPKPLQIALLTNGAGFGGPALGFAIYGGGGGYACLPTGGLPEAEGFSAVQPLLQELDNWANGLPEDVENASAPRRPLHSSLATVHPVAPPDPSAIFLDGLGGNIVQLDLKTGVTLSQVTPPVTAIGPLAIRPTPTLSSTEVWVANGATQVSVLNMTSQSVTTNISTPSIPSSATPAGIVFTNSGSTGFEALRLSSPDASGNLGVLVIFDAVNRVVSSTFALKYAPETILMAPDGLTAYILSTGGEITYYDVLSGTADLSASTYTPGMNNGFSGVGNVFIHPDGTRLFWAVGPYMESFNLTTRMVTAQFNSGLPTTSAITLGLSQDGALATMSNGQGAAVVLDTQYGLIQAAIQFASPSQIFLGN
jgi:hypothetical protein